MSHSGGTGRSWRRSSGLAIWVLAFPLSFGSVASAQAVSGAIEGTVVGEGGAPSTGVEVTIRSGALQGSRRQVSDGRGRFTFLAIPAGTYEVELRAVGYVPVLVHDIVVPLGAARTLDPITLQRRQAVQLEQVIISGARPILDLSSASISTTLDSSLFRALPTARDIRSLLSIVPTGNPSFFGDGVNVAGSTGFENAYYINGIHATNPLSGDGSINVPFNFVKEVQVVGGGYEAEFGRGQGAIVNVLTNSGGNEFRGEVVGYFSGQPLRATPQWGIAESPADRFSQYDVGFSFGGPIKRDRVWFFVAYNPLVENKDVEYKGLLAMRDQKVRQLFAGKLSWQPSTETDVSLSLIGDPTAHTAVEAAEVWPAPLPTIADPRVVMGDFREGGVATALQLRRQVGSRLLFTGSINRLTNTRQHARRIGTDDPVTLARVEDYTTNTTSGNFGRSYRAHTRRDAADASLTILAPAHTVKVGASFERNTINIPFFLSSRVERIATDMWIWSRDDWSGRGRNAVPALFAQDSWELSPRLRINSGLRWEGQSIRGDTGMRVSIRNEIAPRVGVVYQPGEPGVHKVTASVGRFFEQIPLWSVSFWTMLYEGREGAYPRNPVVDSSGRISTATYTFAGYPFDPDMKGQHYDELTLGYERRIGTEYRASVRATRRELRWVIEDAINAGGTIDAFEWNLGNPGRGLLSHVPRARRRYTGFAFEAGRTGGAVRYLASYTLSWTRGNYSGEFETDTRVPSSHFQQSMDWPVQWVNHDGYLPNDRRHLAKLSGTWQAGPALTIGVASWYASGTPLSDMSTGPLRFQRVHVRERGSAGRTPSIWNADVRVAWELGARDRWTPQLVLDAFNIGNQRKAVDFEQLHYLDMARTVASSNYLKVNQYQAPLRVRLGMVVGF